MLSQTSVVTRAASWTSVVTRAALAHTTLQDDDAMKDDDDDDESIVSNRLECSQLSLSQYTLVSTISNKTAQLLPLSVTLYNKESHYLPPPRSRTRASILCHQKEHGQFKCLYLINYGAFPLPDGDMELR